MKENLYRYLTSNAGALSLEDILLNFLTATVLGMLIYFSYRISHSGTVYSPRFNVSLVMLTLVTTLVMNVIGNNIALSLGMVGALSIVRFRTAIKDPRDTAYIFWCVAVGICCGVSEYLIAGIGSAVLFLFLLLFGMAGGNERFLLVVRGARENQEEIEKMVSIWYRDKARLRVQNTSADTVEYIYELSQKLIEIADQRSGAISESLYQIAGIQHVNIVCQNDEIGR